MKKRIRYWFDRMMGKGTIALVGVLFLMTAVVVVFTGLLGSLCNGELSPGNSVWQSLMHAIDAGTIAGDSTSNITFIILMCIVTLCGIFVTSILIGIISSGFEEKLNSLRKGFSEVLEKNHTVIIGFNDGIYTLLTELIEANLNHKRGCIIVIGDEDKEVMDEKIKNHIEDFKTTEIICRSGNVSNATILQMASVQTAKSIIINQEDDMQVIKTLLSTVTYLKKKDAFQNEMRIVTLIHNEENLDAARIAGEGKADVLYLADLLGRIIAHTCRQPGLSKVLTEFFDFDGDEFYYEGFPILTGRTFGETLSWFCHSVVVGIVRNGEPMLNPPMDTVIEEGDLIIHLAEDDGASVPACIDFPVQKELIVQQQEKKEPYNILIIGQNSSISMILEEMNQYVIPGSTVTIADNEAIDESLYEMKLSNFKMEMQQCDICKKEVLEKLLSNGATNVLLLNSKNNDTDAADNKTILILLQLRDISSRMNLSLNITSEMKSVENQMLCKVANVNDFVVGNSLASLIMTQISENPKLLPLFIDLLDSDGSEIYMKEASSYVKLNQPVNMYTMTEAAKIRNEIFVGYKRETPAGMEIITNPVKTDVVTFVEKDMVIVIAED